jgi:hypothetical protein
MKELSVFLAGNVQGSQKGCTMILEAVATHDLWIWHSFFGMLGSNNDINVLQCSPIFKNIWTPLPVPLGLNVGHPLCHIIIVVPSSKGALRL